MNRDTQVVKVENDESAGMMAEVLEKGGLVVYPTDTAYGLGADATNAQAIARLYEVKGRDLSKPTHVVVRDWQMIEELCVVDERARRIFEAFMPGPLTMVLRDKGIVEKSLGAGTGTLGVRMPKYRLTLDVAKRLNKPFTTPSANRSGGKTPYGIQTVRQELGLEGVDLVIDGGELEVKLPSTVVDLSGDFLKVIREGPIGKLEIQKAISPEHVV